MKPYKAIFFDLDHTLWDFDTNSAEALRELHHAYGLHHKGVGIDEFLKTFQRINAQLWHQYDTGEIPQETIRKQRFHRVLLEHNIDEYEMSLRFSRDYVSQSPKKKNLLPHAQHVLMYLQPKYSLHVITNGFSEIQTIKMTSSGILDFFTSVITSEKAGHKKPSKEIFEFALHENQLRANEAVMIGDNLITDIGGARAAELDTVYFNPNGTVHDEQVTHEIKNLLELKSIL
ncbi:MAG: YjjG family noncanonical pyrimidine nucleotidase [Flammeovirgaceae bacterium]